MAYNNLTKSIGLLVTFVMLVGCIPSRGIDSSRGNEEDENDNATLSTTLNISNTPLPVGTLTPEPVLMQSTISSGWAVYSVRVSQDPVVLQIFLKNLDTGEITQLTHAGNNNYPIWSPDGSQIMFLSWTEENLFDIYLMDKNGRNQRPIVAGPSMDMMADWSPDGNKIAYVSDMSGDSEIYVLDLQTNTSAKILIDFNIISQFPKWSPGSPKWSPDGKRIAFVSTTGLSNTSQIFAMNIDGTDVTQLTDYNVSANQDHHYDGFPAWCPDASCIVFARDFPKLMLIDVSTREVMPLLNKIFSPEVTEYAPVRSRNYVTFCAGGVFYAIDMTSRKVYPLDIEAVNLSLFP